MPDSLLSGRFAPAAATSSSHPLACKLPRYEEAATFDFRSQMRSLLIGMSPADTGNDLLTKLKLASAMLFLERAVQGITASRSAELSPYLSAVLERRGDEVLPAIKNEYDALRTSRIEPGEESLISQRSKVLFSLMHAINVLSCT